MSQEETKEKRKRKKKFICKYCGKKFGEFWKLGNHVKNECEEAKKAKALAEEALPEGIYKGGLDANKLLNQILVDHPDVKDRHVKEIMSWADMSGGLHPSQVAWLLGSMRGIDTKTANLIAQKYSLALMKAQREGAMQPQVPMVPGLPTATTQQPTFPVTPMQAIQQTPLMWPQPGAMTPGFPPITQPSGMYTQQDVEKMRDDWAKAERLKKVEDVLASLGERQSELYKELPNMIKNAMPQTQPSGDYEEVSEYIDGEGNIVDPNKAVSVRMIRRPIKVTGEPKEDFLDKLIKLKQAGLWKEGPGEDTLRKIIREEKGEKEEESPAMKVLREKLDTLSGQYNEQTKKFDDLKEKMSDEERQRMQDSITNLQSQISGLVGQIRAGGVTTPEGVLATAITEAGRREPVRVAIEGLERLAGPAAPPGQATPPAPPAERKGLVEQARKYGLVETIRRGVRGQ